MPLKLVRDDLLHMCQSVDAIVNPTDSYYSGGGGIDFLVHRAAGPDLDRICGYLPMLERGKSNATPGFRCGCKYIFHTCGPVWYGGMYGEEEELVSCYRSCLWLAKNNQCESVAFPLISSGTFGYPKDSVLRVAMNTVMQFLAEEDCDLMVYLVIYDKYAYSLGSKLVDGIEERITDEYAELHGAIKDFFVEGTLEEAYQAWMEEQELIHQRDALRYEKRKGLGSNALPYEDAAQSEPKAEQEQPWDDGEADLWGMPEEDGTALFTGVPKEKATPYPCDFVPGETVDYSCTPGFAETAACSGQTAPTQAAAPFHAVKPRKLTEKDEKALDALIRGRDEGFRDVLVRFIDARGLKDSEAYNRSNVSRSVYNKIINNPEYRAGKQIVLAFAAGLHLNMEETRELLEKAGHSFTSKPFDVIVRYCLENGIYDISEINAALFRYDLTLLGSGMKS